MKKILLALSLFNVILLNSPNISAAVLVVLNKNDSNLAIVDAKKMIVLAKIQTGDSPHEVVLSADGKTAFVANYGAQTAGSSLSVIDLEAKRELRRVDVLPLMRPHGLQEIGGKIYFTAETNRAIARYDPTANGPDLVLKVDMEKGTVLSRVETGKVPDGIALAGM